MNYDVRWTVKRLRAFGVLDWARRLCERKGHLLEDALRPRSGNPAGERQGLAETRRELIAVIVATLGLGWKEAGRVFGVDHTSILRQCRTYEEQLRRQYEAERHAPRPLARALPRAAAP